MTSSAPSRRVEILIVSYAKDVEWCRFNLASIRKYARGFSGVKVLVPVGDAHFFEPMAEQQSTPETPIVVKTYKPNAGAEFNHHQAMKCYADVWCPEADFILHTDSDCIFTEPVTPDDYFVDGRPILLKERYANFNGQGPVIWQKPTEEAIGVKCEWETMRRHPAVHYRNIYGSVRDCIEKRHSMPFTEYVVTRGKGGYPDLGFSEFNTLGSFAEYFFSGSYHVIELPSDNVPPAKLSQAWSWEGITPQIRAQLEAHVKL